MSLRGYSLGGPVWSHSDWVGNLFARGSKPGEYLAQYASVFNAVEGNTTFYATPAAHVVERWLEQTPSGFEFCFKLPRIVTHEIRLRQHAWIHVDRFLEAIWPLGPRLGPFLLQLPPSFSGRDFDVLELFVRRLPREVSWALEVRHPDYFDDGPVSRALDALLAEHGVDRVIFDTRGAFESDPSDPAVQLAQRKKPRTAWKAHATGARPLVRYCGRPDPDAGHDDERIDFWAQTFANWIAEGRRPLFFAHTPGDQCIPQLARRFHDRLSAYVDVGELPAFPGAERQLTLF